MGERVSTAFRQRPRKGLVRIAIPASLSTKGKAMRTTCAESKESSGRVPVYAAPTRRLAAKIARGFRYYAVRAITRSFGKRLCRA